MITIYCNNPCIYQNEGNCTLTHVISVSQPSEKTCAYFSNKKENKVSEESQLL